ncbi:MAG TPA: type II toxin-antitoxin system RelE/ParE family toxin [Novosphingobium sp.]
MRDFLLPVARDAARRAAQSLLRTPNKLIDYPRIGEKVDSYEPREVRRIIVGAYEMHYELIGETIYIVRVWRGREFRDIS